MVKPKSMKISVETNEPAINLALDTIKINKQAIFFCNSKRGAESLGEKISKKIKTENRIHQKISDEALNALPKPTKQCTRLALMLKKGIAFHHAGLNSKQREIIEDNFRNGGVKIICATPTLAYGLDMPAFRVIIKDVRRFGPRGMDYIPVLEYEQMSGRAGRPGQEDFGQAISLAQSKAEKTKLVEKYIKGEPEEIYSKLAVEPVLRTYILSLIASDFVDSVDSLMSFFEKTFYAHQFHDLKALRRIITKMTDLLEEWEFIKIKGSDKRDDFSSAYDLAKKGEGVIEATPIGRRVSELYLDPLSANYILTSLRKATSRSQVLDASSFLFMISRCLELRPYLRVRMAEYDELVEKMMETEKFLLEKDPSEFTPDYEDYIHCFKTSMFFAEWIDETGEDILLEKYSIRPGEITVKLDVADWLLFCSEEMSRMLSFHLLRNNLAKLRLRLKYGAKEELLPLLKLKKIGRVRARKLFNAGIKSIGDVRTAKVEKLSDLVGKAITKDIKKQVGEDVDIKIEKPKRNLHDFIK